MNLLRKKPPTKADGHIKKTAKGLRFASAIQGNTRFKPATVYVFKQSTINEVPMDLEKIKSYANKFNDLAGDFVKEGIHFIIKAYSYKKGTLLEVVPHFGPISQEDRAITFYVTDSVNVPLESLGLKLSNFKQNGKKVTVNEELQKAEDNAYFDHTKYLFDANRLLIVKDNSEGVWSEKAAKIDVTTIMKGLAKLTS